MFDLSVGQESEGKQVLSGHQTLLNILADLNIAVNRMVSILSLISNSASLLSKPLRAVLSAPNTISIILTQMFHNIFHLFGKIKVFVFIFPQ